MNTGQIIFVLIFFGIIIALIVIAVYGSIKDRRTKKYNELEIEKLRYITKEDRYTILIRLAMYFNYLETYLNEYEPNAGMVSLSDVNTFGENLIEKTLKSEELKGVFKDVIRKEELKEHLTNLSKQKPSNWKTSPITFASYNILKAKAQIILDDAENKELVQKVRKDYEIKFT